MALNDENEETKRNAADSLFGFYLRKKEYTKAKGYLQYFSDKDPMKKLYQGRLYKEQGENENAYKMLESVLFSEYNTLNFALSQMSMIAMEEGDMQKVCYLKEKARALAKVFEMGKYQECVGMLDVVCAQKNVEETYYIAEQLLNSVDSLGDFRKSKLYRHMAFSEPNQKFVEGLKEKILDGFRDQETFGYMSGNADWEALITQ